MTNGGIGGPTPEPAPDPEFRIERVLDASRTRVFSAFTDPREFARWFGPDGFLVTRCEIDAQPGGRIDYVVRAPGGSLVRSGGLFREVRAPDRLSFTDGFVDEAGARASPTAYGMPPEWPEETVVTVTLEPHGKGTKATVRQSVPESLANRLGQTEGWEQSFDRLARHLGSAAGSRASA
jgi:uncharacterized protein YndB with AHSA1/START domain